MSVPDHTSARGALAASLAAMLLVGLCGCGVSRRAESAAVVSPTLHAAPVRSDPPAPAGARQAPRAVSVVIDPRPVSSRVPREFLGLSFEVSALHQIAQYGRVGDLATMLRSLGAGVLRFGGVSADTRTAWTDALTPLPGWASSGITSADLRGLRVLAEKSGWHVLLTLGLAHFEPRAAAREAAAARTALGGWLAGIEVGNEPDAYTRHALRPDGWGATQYNGEVTAYRRAIAKVAPGLALVAPDVSGSHAFRAWGRRVAVGQRPALLTGHHYPLGCHGVAPSISALLSGAVRRKEGSSLQRYLSVSRANHARFRLDEANTVSCGGKAGISNTYASALWAADYIVRAMVAGADGINLQGAPANCLGYSPLCAPTPQELASGALLAQPEWYALLMSRELAGDVPLRAIVSPRQANVDIFALAGPHRRLHLVVVDDEPPGAPGADIRLRLGPLFRAAAVLPLTGPAPSATAGVSLGGRAVETNGGFSPPAQLARRPDRGGVIALYVAPSSATLATAEANG